MRSCPNCGGEMVSVMENRPDGHVTERLMCKTCLHEERIEHAPRTDNHKEREACTIG